MKPVPILPLLLLTLAGCSRPDNPDQTTDQPASAVVDTTAVPVAPPAESPEPAVAAAPVSRGPATSSTTPAPTGVGAGGEALPGVEAAQGDSAARILEQAAASYEAVGSLQAEFTMSYENPLLRSRTTGSGTLYQKRPDRLLLRFREPAGDVILSDGQYFWVYYPSVDAAQVLRSAASAGSSSGVDLQAQFLGDPTRRFEYVLNGSEPVAGRPAWQFTLTPRERAGYQRLRVWIDQRDHLARRFEITEENGSVRRFELSGLRVDLVLADALFRFEVPAGARVIAR